MRKIPSFLFSRKSFKSEKTFFFLWSLPCLILSFKLLFGEKGILDFQKKEKVIQEKKNKLENIREHNKHLVSEIEKIKKNKKYQKYLVKKHLGSIDPSEYLILFSRNSSKPSLPHSSMKK